MAGSGPSPENDPDLLELRIHGVRNTPPHEILLTVPSQVVFCRGDALAGFSTYAEPLPRSAPKGRHVEAYGWGLLARFTGVPTLGRVGDGLVRVLWFSLAPFGLANTAYWSRNRIGKDEAGDTPELERVPGAADAAQVARTISTGVGAGTVRLFGLLLTLLYVTTAASVAWDMLADQCFTGGPGPDTLLACGPFSPLFAPLLGFSAGARAAVLLVIPLAALSVVLTLPLLGRTRYLPGPREGEAPPPPAGGLRTDGNPPPLLGRRDLWIVGAGMGRLRRIHAGAAVAWLAGIMAVDRLDSLAEAGWGPALARSWGWTVLAGSALVLVAAGGAWLFRPQTETPGAGPRLFHRAYLALSIVLLGVAIVLSAIDAETPSGGRAGEVAATAVVLLVASVLTMILAQSLWASGTAAERRFLGWGGLGPFVFASLATGFGLLLSLAAVMVSGWLLGGLEAPMVFMLHGAGFALLLLGAVVVVSTVQLWVWWRGRDGAPAERAAVRRDLVHDAGEWADAAVITIAARRVWRVRRLTALLRRAETVTGWTAGTVFVGGWAGGVLAVMWLAGRPASDSALWDAVRATGAAGLWAGVIVVAVLVIASARGDARPFALLWDLMCFLPTQAHPFGPPCYSERVVPELSGRIQDWLDGKGGDCAPAGNPARRRVVLSAHSMGLVLTVCTLFHLKALGVADRRLARIGVVSYGVQVRRYFGRFFPQVMGPAVMDNVPAGPPSATGRNPWPPTLEEEVAGEAAADTPGAPTDAGNLRALVGERWLNLYRPTDPLGFPVRYSAGARDPDGVSTDGRAEEFKRGSYQFAVASHTNYLETRAYARAFSEVARRVFRD